MEVVLDVRLNNTSQLAAFAKYPDIKYFLQAICNIDYTHDTKFSPAEATFKKYKKKEINWNQFVEEFSQTMNTRNINKYIQSTYSIDKKICLLCSEPTADQCHRRLVGNEFQKVFNELEVIHL